jgi:hypothetical protein
MASITSDNGMRLLVWAAIARLGHVGQIRVSVRHMVKHAHECAQFPFFVVSLIAVVQLSPSQALRALRLRGSALQPRKPTPVPASRSTLDRST